MTSKPIQQPGIRIPTLKGLNQFSAVRVHFLLLRCLNTSDMTFHFQLLHPSTVRDIVGIGMRLIVLAEQEGELDFSNAEKREWMSYIENMEAYYNADSTIHEPTSKH